MLIIEPYFIYLWAKKWIMAETKQIAMLLFYEQNNLSRFKEIFINQFEFAVKTYF